MTKDRPKIGQRPVIPARFQSPAGLADTSKLLNFDQWFIETWRSDSAINKPQGNLKYAATRLSRHTVRQAWWNVQHSLEPYTYGANYQTVKVWAEKVQKLATKLKEQFGAKPIHLLEGGVLDEARMRIEMALKPFEIETVECTKLLRDQVKNLGAPEYTAFTKPFVESAVFMTGILPPAGKSNNGQYTMADAIEHAWFACGGEEHANWSWQIRIVRDGLPANLQSLTTVMPNQHRAYDNFVV